MSNDLQVDVFRNEYAFLIAELKENIWAQEKTLAELKANSFAQDLALEECRKQIAALRAERGSWKAQNASQNRLREEIQGIAT